MTKEEKFQLWMKYRGLTTKQIASDLEMEYATTRTFITRGISINFLIKIVRVYPDIDLNWLLKESFDGLELLKLSANSSSKDLNKKDTIAQKLRELANELETICI